MTDRFSAKWRSLHRWRDSQQEQKDVWYTTQYEHWRGWLKEWSGPGAYGRKNWHRSAQFLYNHIVNPQMLVYLAEAAGIDDALIKKAAKEALARHTMMAMSAVIRRLIPWELIEEALLARQPRATTVRLKGTMSKVFVVHHNPNSGRYRYGADPDDAIASAKALMTEGESTWVAGNCQRMMRVGDLLLFKFGGSRLRQEPGIYAAAHVTRAPADDGYGTWLLRYQPEAPLTRLLMRSPIVGHDLARVVARSFGASVQIVRPPGRAVLGALLGDTAMWNGKSPGDQPITHGLMILKEPLDKILAGTKTWEIRGKATLRRGPIALIESKSGEVVGLCDLVNVVGPLTLAELRRNHKRSGFRPTQLHYPRTYAWVVTNARRLAEPVRYRHPQGAVIWVRLEAGVARRLHRETVRAR